MRVKSLMTRVMVCGAVCCVAMAAGADTAKLKAAVADLSAEQQAALLLFLDSLGSDAGEAAAAPAASSAQSFGDALRAQLEAYEAALKNNSFSLEDFTAHLSEDFYSALLGDKDSIVGYLKSMGLFSGDVPQLGFKLDDMEVDEVDEFSVATPIDVTTPLGNFELEVTGQLEEDGVWRMVEVNVLGF